MKQFEDCLWGVKDGAEDWQEDLLSTNPEAFERVKVLAARDGYGHFRIARVDLSEKPDFKKTLTVARKA